MSELARRLKITRSRLTHAVNRLTEAGLVDRCEDPADGRGRLAVLTDDGMTLLEQAAPGQVEAVRRAVFDALSREQVCQLAEIGGRLGRRCTGWRARRRIRWSFLGDGAEEGRGSDARSGRPGCCRTGGLAWGSDVVESVQDADGPSDQPESRCSVDWPGPDVPPAQPRPVIPCRAGSGRWMPRGR
ncbi:hypothetical protein AQI96_31380 [Streptomyces canus]|uniref:MarR family winged helix-turn-helix transcriptional regulator n=1 Tax=Streptomyces canus TaxID=58343 RepID=UPI0007492EDA|nr:hypothetical protein AQI96_31380 [Streptomyces canus]